MSFYVRLRHNPSAWYSFHDNVTPECYIKIIAIIIKYTYTHFSFYLTDGSKAITRQKRYCKIKQTLKKWFLLPHFFSFDYIGVVFSRYLIILCIVNIKLPGKMFSVVRILHCYKFFLFTYNNVLWNFSKRFLRQKKHMYKKYTIIKSYSICIWFF